MTNEEKYRTVDERIKMFNKFCTSNSCDCSSCKIKIRNDCKFRWLALEADEETTNKTNSLVIKIKYFNPDATTSKISKIKQGDWIDLRAAETVTLKAGEFKLIPLGIGMKLPAGYEAHIVPRSSTFMKFGIIQTNHMGVIDESYCGDEDEWKFPAYALRDTTINANDRICQFRIMKKQPEVTFEEVEHLESVSRHGFGSTGTN